MLPFSLPPPLWPFDVPFGRVAEKSGTITASMNGDGGCANTSRQSPINFGQLHSCRSHPSTSPFVSSSYSFISTLAAPEPFSS